MIRVTRGLLHLVRRRRLMRRMVRLRLLVGLRILTLTRTRHGWRVCCRLRRLYVCRVVLPRRSPLLLWRGFIICGLVRRRCLGWWR